MVLAAGEAEDHPGVGLAVPGHRVGVLDLDLAAIGHANPEGLEGAMVLGLFQLLDLHRAGSFDYRARAFGAAAALGALRARP